MTDTKVVFVPPGACIEVISAPTAYFVAHLTLPMHLAEFLSCRVAEVEARLDGDPSGDVGMAFVHSGKTLDQFYRDGDDTILYDLVDFNTWAEYYPTRLHPLHGFKGKKIFDFGCGIGAAAIFLTLRGNDVTAYDISPRLIEFCQYRVAKLNLRGVRYTKTVPDSLDEYDLVTAIDVLEHIPDLRAALLDLGAKMRRGAKLYHHDEFEKELHIHINHSAHIHEWLEEAGFIEFDERWAIKI